MICIFASELAALAGRHPFQDQEKAIQTAIARNSNTGDGLATGDRLAAAEERKRRLLVRAAAQRVARRLELQSDNGPSADTGELARELDVATHTLSQARKAHVDKLVDVAVASAVVQGVPESKARRAIDAQDAEGEVAVMPCIRAAREARGEAACQSAVDAAPQELQEAVATGDVRTVAGGNLPDDVLTVASGAACCNQGTREEEACLDRCAAKLGRPLGRKQRSLRRVLTTATGVRWVMFGRIDASDGGHIVETKSRQYKLLGYVPPQDMVQLHAYMYMDRSTEALLNEDYCGESMQHMVAFDSVVWASLMDDMEPVIQRIHACRTPRS